MTARIFMAIAALLGGLSVAAGAFATHGLRPYLSDRAITSFETGARYQMYHALALLLVALFLSRAEGASSWLVASGIAFLVGIGLFSGSLYALSLSGLSGFGIVTPLGGAAFLIGWLCLAVAAWSSNGS